jgi:hypothetical protein
MKSQTSFIQILCILLVAVFTSACASNQPEMAIESSAQPAIELYEVHHEGRIHVFYDRKLYTDFLALGETPFRLTRIGAGPNQETLVFGLTKKDKKKPGKVDAINLFDGKLDAPADFYGELRNHGRIYVFNNFEDMQPVRQFGHPNFFYTEIGAGPKGETVVYVLNKKTKKKRPDALIATFRKHNS